ncbi:40765_t:CDS:2 [Gigaspora margarita]|uniref:40765_t:CDS:1 n=1 Tax=Gigaspora margarita TaxID=4874 RepID=A0ABN7VPT9_GIGMA|nr:40765_t:CDS:2 [Gigaspora margarita]
MSGKRYKTTQVAKLEDPLNDIRNLFEFEHSHQSGIGVKQNEFKVPNDNQISIPTNLFYYINNSELRKVNMSALVKDCDDHKNKFQTLIYHPKPVEVGYTNATWDPRYCNYSDNNMVKDRKTKTKVESIAVQSKVMEYEGQKNNVSREDLDSMYRFWVQKVENIRNKALVMELKEHIKDVPLHGLINETPENPRRLCRQEWISEGKSAKPSQYKDGKRKYIPERLKTINNVATSYHQKIPEDIMLIIFLVSRVFILSNLGDCGKKKVVIEMYKKKKKVFHSNHMDRK